MYVRQTYVSLKVVKSPPVMSSDLANAPAMRVMSHTMHHVASCKSGHLVSNQALKALNSRRRGLRYLFQVATVSVNYSMLRSIRQAQEPQSHPDFGYIQLAPLCLLRQLRRVKAIHSSNHRKLTSNCLCGLGCPFPGARPAGAYSGRDETDLPCPSSKASHLAPPSSRRIRLPARCRHPGACSE